MDNSEKATQLAIAQVAKEDAEAHQRRINFYRDEIKNILDSLDLAKSKGDSTYTIWLSNDKDSSEKLSRQRLALVTLGYTCSGIHYKGAEGNHANVHHGQAFEVTL